MDFISYNGADRNWAEWIAWQLETAGYRTVLQAWDFQPGENFVMAMQKAMTEAERTLAVLSPDYLDALYTQPEWAAAFAADPTGSGRRLVPVRVKECELKGLLAQIIYIDLVGLDQTAARDALLAGLDPSDRLMPATEPVFPGSSGKPEPSFPGTTTPKRPPRHQAVQPPAQGNQTINVGGNVMGSVLNQGTITGGINVGEKTPRTGED